MRETLRIKDSGFVLIFFSLEYLPLVLFSVLSQYHVCFYHKSAIGNIIILHYNALFKFQTCIFNLLLVSAYSSNICCII